jgi:hypothetical protein
MPNYTPRPLPSQADRMNLIAQLSKYPQHPDTEAGQQAHQAQQADWAKTYSLGTHVMESMPYPLRPGTAPVNSGECFTCRQIGHMGQRESGSCGGNFPLHPNEQSWRVLCTRILKELRRMANIQLVAVDDYGTTWEDIQGNGEGPSS